MDQRFGGELSDTFSGVGQVVGAPERVTHRSVAEEDAVRVEGHGLICRVVVGHHRDLAAEGGQAAQDVLLDAKVVRHNLHGQPATDE